MGVSRNACVPRVAGEGCFGAGEGRYGEFDEVIREACGPRRIGMDALEEAVAASEGGRLRACLDLFAETTA